MIDHENLERTSDLPDEQYVHAPPLIEQVIEQLFSNAAEHTDSERASVDDTLKGCRSRVRSRSRLPTMDPTSQNEPVIDDDS